MINPVYVNMKKDGLEPNVYTYNILLGSENRALDSEVSKNEFIQENKGRIWRFSDWGMRRLAYKIQKAKNTYYILLNFELEAKLINDFKTMLDQNEGVIRHLVMKRDKAETEACPPLLYFPPCNTRKLNLKMVKMMMKNGSTVRKKKMMVMR